MSDSERETQRREEKGTGEIDRHLMDDQAEGQQEIVDAAARASEIDRSKPGSSERRERSHDVEDPSHSKGSPRRRS
jgi:hypothetical protein